MSWVKDKNLKIAIFLPWQPSQDLKYSLSAADISTITLTDETALQVFLVKHTICSSCRYPFIMYSI